MPEDPLGAKPSEPPPTPPFTPPAVTEGTGLPRNISAALACIFLLPGGVVFYILDRRDAFVRLYALQSIVLSAVSFALYLAFYICFLIVAHIWGVRTLFTIAARLCDLGFLVLWILLILNAYQGRMFEMPVLWRMAKRYIPQNFL